MNSQIFMKLVNPVMAGVFACIFTLVWLRIRKSSLGYIAAAFAIGAVMFYFQSFWPLGSARMDVFVIYISLIGLVISVSCAALARVGEPIPVGAFAAISVFYLAVFAWLLYVQPSLETRVHLANLTMLAILGITISRLVRRRSSQADDIVIAITSICGLYFVWRSMALLLFETDGILFGTVDLEIFWTMNILMTLALTVFMALGYVVALAFELYDQVRGEAYQDQLSGTLNRRGFEKAAQTWLEANPDVPATMIIADIDHFKRVNDTYGHGAGDNAIARFGQLLSVHAAENYIVARIGGEEFAVLIPRAVAHEARLYVETVRSSLAGKPVPGLPSDFRFTASFGIRPRSFGDSLSDLLRGADRALYTAKADGRNAIAIDLDTVKAG